MSNHADTTKKFFSLITEEAKDLIIAAIADDYGESKEAIEQEVTAEKAEHLLDYMREPHRRGAFALMRGLKLI